MSKTKVYLRLSWLLLAISFLALAASPKLKWSEIVLLPMFIVHFAVIMINVSAQNAWRKLPNRSWTAAVRAFPRWLIALGVAVAIVVLAVWPSLTLGLREGKTETGEPVTQQEWYGKHGRYFLKQNAGPPKEISRAEYEELSRRAFPFFSVVWLLFSYCGLCFWQAVLHMQSEEAARSG